MKFLLYLHVVYSPALCRYTRNLVDSGNGKFNLIVLCWTPDQGSSIHDHANAHCFAKVLEGSLDEVMYVWPEREEQQVRQRETYHHNTDEVTYINGEARMKCSYILTSLILVDFELC